MQGPAVRGDAYHATSAPIYQTATFAQASTEACGPYDYSRSGNPTRTALEEQLAALAGGERAFAYASGMAALAAALRLLAPGDEVLAGADLYGGTFRLLTRIAEPAGVRVRFADTSDAGAVERELSARTRLLLLETPSNPRLRISDLRRLAELAHACGAWHPEDLLHDLGQALAASAGRRADAAR